MSDRELLAAYRSTAWTVDTAAGALSVRPGTPAPAALRPSGIVTAFNPASRRLDEAANRRADAGLRARIAALRLAARPSLAHGTGDDSTAWDEPGWCVPGDVRGSIVTLGTDFDQNAIVWIDAVGEVTIVCTRDGFCGAGIGDVL